MSPSLGGLPQVPDEINYSLLHALKHFVYLLSSSSRLVDSDLLFIFGFLVLSRQKKVFDNCLSELDGEDAYV